MKKDTVYVDIDDEITNITEKVSNSSSSIVALVLPKRCSVLQSQVNMKILKKTAKASSKNVVLITSEAPLMAIAGSVGLPVAKTLQSKPVIPKAAPTVDEDEAVVAEGESAEDLDEDKSIGELDDKSKTDDDEEAIELSEDATPAEASKATKAEGKKDRKLKVPNFTNFRFLLFGGIGLVIVLIVFIYLAVVVLPKANVTVTTKNESIPVNLSITASPTAKTVDVNGKTVPVTTQNLSKTESKQFQATGQKDVGDKAVGTMTIFNCSSDLPVEVPTGTIFTNSGLSFVTTSSVTVPNSSFKRDGTCNENGYLANVAVVATAGGDKYNLSAGRTYNSNKGSSIYGKGSAMSGGTTKVVAVVSQEDCTNAGNSLLNVDINSFQAQLTNNLKSAGLTPIKDTFTQNHSTPVCTPGVGQEASAATASSEFKFTMAGVNTDGLKQIISEAAKGQIKSGQSIFDVGVDKAVITLNGSNDSKDGSLNLNVTATAQTGIKQDPNEVAKMIAGKKYGPSVQILKDQSGVSNVEIKYSPFWVNSTPKNVKHIKVKFVSANGS